MSIKGCIAMILAGGHGKRLGALTHYYSKPAIHFGGNYRIIDFTLSNCIHSGLETVGILSQHFSTDLHIYINTIKNYKSKYNGIYMLPSQNDESYYNGTADSVYKNIDFIDKIEPVCVLVLAGDHIYKMDYEKMIAFHRETGADVTVASTPVSKAEASRFGIINADGNKRIYEFEEKPVQPKSNLASMGIYVFKWSTLKKYLRADHESKQTQHDFGKDILPKMLYAGERIYTYKFDGYWRDVGTVDSLWEANMELINDPLAFQLQDDKWDIYSSYMSNSPNIKSNEAVVHESILSGGSTILGKVEHSVLGDSVTIGKGAEIVNSVIMPNVYIGNNAKIYNAVIGTRAAIMDNTTIGLDEGLDCCIDRRICSRGISLVAPWLHIPKDMKFQNNSHIYKERLQEWIVDTDMIAEPSLTYFHFSGYSNSKNSDSDTKKHKELEERQLQFV